MEYFNVYNNRYVQILKTPPLRYKIRLCLLGEYENILGEITKDISITAQGQINISKQLITRRSCSITLYGVENNYLPCPDSPIWFKKKFKLLVGVVDKSNNDIYWWSQGVYFIQNASSDGTIVNIDAVDKGGLLDGSLSSNLLENNYVIMTGSRISDVIKDTLMLDSGKGCIDPIPPIIDTYFNNVLTECDITINSNSYIGDIFSSLGENYKCDVYYDADGHMRFHKTIDAQYADCYKYLSHQWDYNDNDAWYINRNYQYSFDGYNSVTVYTNISETEKNDGEDLNVSYTARNNNPMSPLRVNLIGVKSTEAKEVKYVNVSKNEMKKRCKDLGDYLLLKESFLGMTLSFDSPIIPHMDVDKPIGITDNKQGLDNSVFVVQSITIPLSAGAMNISATNINWLPNNFDIEGRSEDFE